ncbi:MAG TPA: hypothetical protein VFQ61_06405 [Polyangiaceae bacterium]|nr:hypothetical protein [Polyangiaceae bacterium]
MSVAEALFLSRPPWAPFHDGVLWWAIRGRSCMVSVERTGARDRGDYVAKIHARGMLALEIDAHDGWPRYYFDAQRCALEIEAWLRRRGQWVGEGEEPPPWGYFGVEQP